MQCCGCSSGRPCTCVTYHCLPSILRTTAVSSQLFAATRHTCMCICCCQLAAAGNTTIMWGRISSSSRCLRLDSAANSAAAGVGPPDSFRLQRSRISVTGLSAKRVAPSRGPRQGKYLSSNSRRLRLIDRLNIRSANMSSVMRLPMSSMHVCKRGKMQRTQQMTIIQRCGRRSTSISSTLMAAVMLSRQWRHVLRVAAHSASARYWPRVCRQCAQSTHQDEASAAADDPVDYACVCLCEPKASRFQRCAKLSTHSQPYPGKHKLQSQVSCQPGGSEPPDQADINPIQYSSGAELPNSVQ